MILTRCFPSPLPFRTPCQASTSETEDEILVSYSFLGSIPIINSERVNSIPSFRSAFSNSLAYRSYIGKDAIVFFSCFCIKTFSFVEKSWEPNEMGFHKPNMIFT